RANDGYRSLAEENKRLHAEIAALHEDRELPPSEEKSRPSTPRRTERAASRARDEGRDEP
ncbi:gas vesicle protein, partial [Streptomyces sp. NPDC056255]